MTEDREQERIKSAVRQAYGGIARRYVDAPDPGGAARGGCCGPSASVAHEEVRTDCCAPQVETPAGTTYYSAAELDGLPDSVTDVSLGCGNPLAIAELQDGEVVLDLGSGGGIDCFLAARQVGPEGRVIGLDMTPDMIKLARRNAKRMGATNVDFRYGEMEEIPLPDASVDAVISNCVINLSPDKDAVFREVFRVLRPGGRMNVSDIVVDGELPQPIRDSLDAWAGCIAGALDEAEYLSKIQAAGFEDVRVLSRSSYVEIGDVPEGENVQLLVAGPDGEIVEGAEAHALLVEAGISPQDLAHKVTSVKVRARKPA